MIKSNHKNNGKIISQSCLATTNCRESIERASYFSFHDPVHNRLHGFHFVALHDSFKVLGTMLQRLRHRNVQVVVGLLSSQVLHRSNGQAPRKKKVRLTPPKKASIFYEASAAAQILKLHLRSRQTWSKCPRLSLRENPYSCSVIEASDWCSNQSQVECDLTGLVHHRQGRHASLHKDVECFDDGSVGVDVSDVMVRTDAQLSQSLLHEGWLWHFTHLEDTRTFTHTKHTIQIRDVIWHFNTSHDAHIVQ